MKKTIIRSQAACICHDLFLGTRLSAINSNRKLGRNNKSGCSGISWCKQSKKWRAHFKFKGKSYWVGVFNDLSLATEAIKKKKEDLYSTVLVKAPIKEKEVIKHLPNSNFVNLTGLKLKHFEVVRFAGRYKTTCKWVCKCECGNTFIATSSEIRNHKIISCGCVTEERKVYSRHLFSNYKDVFVDGTNLYIMNKDVPNISNKTSKVRGVYKPKRGSWYAKLTFQGVDHRIKCATKEEAIKARTILEQKYYLPFMKKHKSIMIKVQKEERSMIK